MHKWGADKIDTEDIISERFCTFPFKPANYRSEGEFDEKCSFKGVPNRDGSGINGPLRLSRKSTMPSMNEDETLKMFIGTVKSIRRVDMQFVNMNVPFQHAVVDAGMGMLPRQANLRRLTQRENLENE